MAPTARLYRAAAGVATSTTADKSALIPWPAAPRLRWQAPLAPLLKLLLPAAVATLASMHVRERTR